MLKHERGRVSFTAAPVESFLFRAARFDVVLLGEMLGHAAYPKKLLGHAAELFEARWHSGCHHS